jgi:hypothetical protein
MAAPTLTPVRIAPPPNPAGIPRETGLAELQGIKSAWVQAAQDAGFPKMLWDVANWLGKPVSIRTYPKTFWKSGNVGLLGSETTIRYAPAQGGYVVERRVSAYVGEAADAETLLLRGKNVARWHWQHVDTAQGEIPLPADDEKKLFIPGKWFNAILTALPDAKTAAPSARRGWAGARTQETAG